MEAAIQRILADDVEGVYVLLAYQSHALLPFENFTRIISIDIENNTIKT